jgi:hypothetical protein
MWGAAWSRKGGLAAQAREQLAVDHDDPASLDADGPLLL